MRNRAEVRRRGQEVGSFVSSLIGIERVDGWVAWFGGREGSEEPAEELMVSAGAVVLPGVEEVAAVEAAPAFPLDVSLNRNVISFSSSNHLALGFGGSIIDCLTDRTPELR
jgi:hypothetical protein